MRHRVYGKHLGRDKDDRDILFKGLLESLFTHGTVQTSQTKAKAIKGLIDKVINLAKEKKIKLLQSFLIDKTLRDRLIKEIVPKMSNRNSGYTQLVRLGTRLGDQTMMVRLSLIGAEELKPIEKVTSKKRKVTRRRHPELVSGSKKMPKRVRHDKMSRPVTKKGMVKK